MTSSRTVRALARAILVAGLALPLLAATRGEPAPAPGAGPADAFQIPVESSNWSVYRWQLRAQGAGLQGLVLVRGSGAPADAQGRLPALPQDRELWQWRPAAVGGADRFEIRLEREGPPGSAAYEQLVSTYLAERGPLQPAVGAGQAPPAAFTALSAIVWSARRTALTDRIVLTQRRHAGSNDDFSPLTNRLSLAFHVADGALRGSPTWYGESHDLRSAFHCTRAPRCNAPNAQGQNGTTQVFEPVAAGAPGYPGQGWFEVPRP